MLCWVSCLLYIEKRCKKSPSKEILDHSILCFVMLCCPLGSGLFSFFFFIYFFFTAKPLGRGQEVQLRPSLDCPPPVDLRWILDLASCAPRTTYPDAYTAATNSVQTNNLPIVYTNIIPIRDVCPLCQKSKERTDAPGGGDQVTAGHKNAYSSLWLVHKLAAGRLGLGLGAEPGPELAQLLAAMLSLPQPQPHCAKPLHTYNLLIIHEVFKGVKKYIANLESRSKTDTD